MRAGRSCASTTARQIVRKVAAWRTNGPRGQGQGRRAAEFERASEVIHLEVHAMHTKKWNSQEHTTKSRWIFFVSPVPPIPVLSRWT